MKIYRVYQMNKNNRQTFSYFYDNINHSPMFFNYRSMSRQNAGSYWNIANWEKNISSGFKIEFVYD